MTFLICISCKPFVRTELEGWCCLLPCRFTASLKTNIIMQDLIIIIIIIIIIVIVVVVVVVVIIIIIMCFSFVPFACCFENTCYTGYNLINK